MQQTQKARLISLSRTAEGTRKCNRPKPMATARTICRIEVVTLHFLTCRYNHHYHNKTNSDALTLFRI